MRPPRAGLYAAVAAAMLAACATPWDPPGLRPHRAELQRHPGQRLSDATPYLLPVQGELIEFFCRWPTDRPLRIHLPQSANRHERRALDAAVAAWESAGLGLRFERVPRPQAEIDVAFLEADQTLRAEGTGFTLADCRLAAAGPGAIAGPRLPAQLDRARIRIVRREQDEWSEEDHAYFAGELTGVMLHELAHALGFQGHTEFVDGILARDTKRSTRVGRRILAGEPFREPTLAALYGLPSGVVLSRRGVPIARTEALDRLLPGRPGPWVRVGDRNGRVFWRAPKGEWGVTLVSVTTARRQPERLVLLPD